MSIEAHSIAFSLSELWFHLRMTWRSVLLTFFWLFGCFFSRFDSFQSWRLWTFTNYHWWPMKIWACGTKQSNLRRCISFKSWKLLFICISFIGFGSLLLLFLMGSYSVEKCWFDEFKEMRNEKMAVEKRNSSVQTATILCYVQISLMQCANSYPSLSFTFRRSDFLLLVRIDVKRLYHAFAFVHCLRLVWWSLYERQ